MKYALPAVVALVVCLCFVSGRSQETSQIGLYIDELRSEHCVYGSGFMPVDVWAWASPVGDGLTGVALKILYPGIIIVAAPTYNDNILSVLGDPANGITAFYADCQYDWTWPFRQTVYLLNDETGLIQTYPHYTLLDPNDAIAVFTCGEYTPRIPAERMSNVCVNFCSEDIDPPILEEVVVVDQSTLEANFDQPVTAESAENVENYAVYNRLTGEDSIPVSAVVLLGDGQAVSIDLAEPFQDNLPYLLTAMKVADETGNAWISNGQFGNGPDLVITDLSFQDTLSGCTELFTMRYTIENIGEYPAQYVVADFYLQPLDEYGEAIGYALNFQDEHLENLAAGESHTQEFSYGSPLSNWMYGHNAIIATIDEYHYVIEAREDNNTHTAPLVWLGPTVTSYGLVGSLLQIEFRKALYDAGSFIDPVTAYEVHRWNNSLRVYDVVMTIPADHSATYSIAIPPFPDAEYTYFFIRALRPTASGTCCYDACERYRRTAPDGPPDIPTGFAGRQTGDDLLLSWDPNKEPDIKYYQIYIGFSPDFIPDIYVNLLATLDSNHLSYLETWWEPGIEVYYKLSAVDEGYNESGFALLSPENFVATMLTSFSADWTENEITVSWKLTEPVDQIQFSIMRATGAKEHFEALSGTPEELGELSYRYRDTEIEPGATYRYRVDLVGDGDRRILFETEPVVAPKPPLTLYQNYPNPFNPVTTIRFYVPDNRRVRLDIFDISGRLVATPVDADMPAGSHAIEWNGSDSHGRQFSSGIYVYRLMAGKESISKKMVLLR